jgi:cytochrome c553
MATVEVPPPITPRISSPTLTSSPESPLKPVLNPFTFHRELALVFGLALGQDVFAIEDFVAEEKAYYLCAGCHGPETGSVLYPMPHDIPTLIGQRKDYLLKQLLAYREGRRKHPNMSDVLANYSDQNLAELAAYYENLGPSRPEHIHAHHRAAIAPVTPVASAVTSSDQHGNSKGKTRKPRARKSPAATSSVKPSP